MKNGESGLISRLLLFRCRFAAVLVVMSALQVVPAAASPCLYWTQTVEESAAALESAGIARVCVAADRVDGWRQAGFDAAPVDAADLAARRPLESPGVGAQVNRVSATRSPWIDANGWRFIREPSGRFRYEDLRVRRGALAAAEAFTYGADVLLQIDPEDLPAVGEMLTFLSGVPADRLPPVADFGVVDDGSEVMGEVMNLLSRRNLLFEVVPAPSPRFRINVALGASGYSQEEAADPSAFALKVRHQLTDAERTLRVFGTEIVICRLTGDADHRRLQLLNYGGREMTGVRIRVRGAYRASAAQVSGVGNVPLEDYVIADGATEFSVPRLTTYGVVELTAAR